jgi:hypothetical protein
MVNTTRVYTDGSGISGHIDSAAVVLSSTNIPDSATLYKRTFYIGRDTESTVHAVELQGICLALQNLETHQDSIFFGGSSSSCAKSPP